MFAVVLTGFTGKCYTHQFAKCYSKCEASNVKQMPEETKQNKVTAAMGLNCFPQLKA